MKHVKQQYCCSPGALIGCEIASESTDSFPIVGTVSCPNVERESLSVSSAISSGSAVTLIRAVSLLVVAAAAVVDESSVDCRGAAS